MNAATTHVRTVLDALERFQANDQLTQVDTQLAAMLLRRGDAHAWSDTTVTAVAVGVALTSRACREGHSAIHLKQLVEQFAQLNASLLQDDAAASVTPSTDAPRGAILHRVNLGTPEQWRDALMASPVVGTGSTRTPVVLHGDLVQFARYYDAEDRIARNILRRLHTPSASHDVPAIVIVTGGPGTGKTTYVARTIVALQRTHPSLRVALAAPTGKAAARLTESVRQRIGEVASDVASPERDDVPSIGAARTLHRLLQYQPATDRYRRTDAAPLDDDLVIVDEASMVDVLMCDALLRAVKPEAGIMLVGDHHQLASVDAGDVLGALYRVTLESASPDARRAHLVELTTSWRFAAQPGIGAFATAILAGDSATALQVCQKPELTHVRQMSWPQSFEELLEPVRPELERCLGAQSPEEFLDALESFRILTPEREGTTGVSGLNQSVEHWFSHRGHVTNGEWYHGRPVMVTANDYSTNIFNGDIGVVWRDAGHTAVYFRSDTGALRAVSPARLPAVETAWAVTVHKAQGSEFDAVMVIVPGHDSRIMSRELLYTAVTRARRRVTLVGGTASIRNAIDRVATRTSGLAQAFTRIQEALDGTKRAF